MNSNQLLGDAISILLRGYKDRLDNCEELQQNIRPILNLKNISYKQLSSATDMPLSTLKTRMKNPSTFTLSELRVIYDFLSQGEEIKPA